MKPTGVITKHILKQMEVTAGFHNPLVDFDWGYPLFSGDSDHFWRGFHPPNNGTGLLILSQHYSPLACKVRSKSLLLKTGFRLGPCGWSPRSSHE